MNLYLVTMDRLTGPKYNAVRSYVVAAEDETSAKYGYLMRMSMFKSVMGYEYDEDHSQELEWTLAKMGMPLNETEVATLGVSSYLVDSVKFLAGGISTYPDETVVCVDFYHG